MSKFKKYERLEQYGSAPIRIIDEREEEYWDSLDTNHRNFIHNHLHQMTQELTNENSIKLLCNVINDLSKKIDALEEKLKNV